MSEEGMTQNIDFNVSLDNLYREEHYTDLKVASIRRLIPIKQDGSKDESRAEQFHGHSQLISPQGPVPLQAQLPANNFNEAIEVFPAAMEKALGEMVERVKQLQKEQDEKKQQEEKKE